MPLDEDSGQPPVLEGRKGRQGRSCLAAIAQAITIAAFSLAIPLTAATQEPGKVYRIGFLGVGGPAAADRNPHSCPSSVKDLSWSAFRQALRELGYAEGHNLVIECRWTEGREERAPALAAELVGLNMDLLVVYGTVQVRAAKQAA